MFTSIITTAGELSGLEALICTGTSLILGFLIARIYMIGGGYSKSFVITLVMLPVLVQAVIMMVNGNLGAGVAVLGTFSLVRFRSVPGTSKEICSIFFAMAVGLATGMGYVTFAIAVTVILGAVFVVLLKTSFGEMKTASKELRVMIPEDLDYTGVFDDIFEKYLKKVELYKVKTTNLGSMFDLHYHIEMKDDKAEKEMIDEIRCRNGNLTVACAIMIPQREEM